MNNMTLSDYVDRHADEVPEEIWLRDRRGEQFTEWSWSEAHEEINAAAAWLENRLGSQKSNVVLLSRNCAHWLLADYAIIASGNVTVPMFTTLTASAAKYIFEFTDTSMLILGATLNWDSVKDVLPRNVEIVTLPGIDCDIEHIRWKEIVAASSGHKPEYEGKSDELVSLVFTSGTTGVPKGVMQTHESMLEPMRRAEPRFGLRPKPRFLSYLPLSHIAERQLIEVLSTITSATITFNESLETLLRDMSATKPNLLFGPPRVWEQLQQGVLANFGSQKGLDQALQQDAAAVGAQVQAKLGLHDADCLITAAAPTPPALIHWFEKLGIILIEGFGQTEIMATNVNTKSERKVGSIGRVADGVELKISAEGELIYRAPGTSIGYYKMPEKTAETFVDGWIHTGDKGYIDDDGYVFITGRVKDYFKTIQGKFVAPTPIENAFAENALTEQLCLLGRGYSKTAMVCVLSDIGRQQSRDEVEQDLLQHAHKVNESVDHHARIGAVIVATSAWTIENEVLTPTLKIRREKVENQFGELAQELARKSAESHAILLEWADNQ